MDSLVRVGPLTDGYSLYHRQQKAMSLCLMIWLTFAIIHLLLVEMSSDGLLNTEAKKS